MKKTLMILTLISVSLFATSALAAGYKVCYFHDVEYAYIPEFNTCPWNAGNLPPEVDVFPPGEHDIVVYNPITLKTEIIHSPECFGEHGGGIN